MQVQKAMPALFCVKLRDGHHLECETAYQLHSSMRIYLKNNSGKFHPDLVKKMTDLSF